MINKLQKTLSAIALIFTMNLAFAVEAPFNSRHLLSEAITKTKKIAYRSGAVDWHKLEQEVYALGKDAKDYVDLLPAYSKLVEGLGDGHSFVNSSDDQDAMFKARYGRGYSMNRPRKKSDSSFKTRREPLMRSLAIGAQHGTLLVVPTMLGGGPNADKYAQTLTDNVRLTEAESCGYVVDLRGNFGGNVWPMLAGLSSLLGTGVVEQGLDYNGKLVSSTRLASGAAFYKEAGNAEQEITHVRSWGKSAGKTDTPVAVLIDDAVASSGEGIAVAFSGRANTRSFGTKTVGVASVNEGFEVGGINLVITTQLMADRNGKTFPEGLTPDQEVTFAEGKAGLDDAIIEAAKRWLEKQASCSKPNPV